MDQFSFVLVLLTVIVGLGITELLGGVAGQIKFRKTVTHSWLHGLTAASIMVALFQQWWESWTLQSVETWSVGNILMLLSGPVFLYLISHLLYPAKLENVDLRNHYWDNSRAIWILGAITVTVATAFRPLSFSDDFFVLDNLSAFIFLPIFVLLAIFRSVPLHAILLPVMFVGLVADILFFHAEI